MNLVCPKHKSKTKSLYVFVALTAKADKTKPSLKLVIMTGAL